MKNIKALLVSLPWVDYASPSFQIGCLSAYAKKQGFRVDAKHMHLHAALAIGLEEYDKLAHSHRDAIRAEAIVAQLLFENKNVVKNDSSQMVKSALYSKVIKALRNIFREIHWKEYTLVGFSTTHSQFFTSLLMAKWIKCDYPGVHIVLGGAPVSCGVGSSVLKHFPQIDWCVCGEGEMALVALLGALQENAIAFEENVPNIVYRSRDGINQNPNKQLADLRGMPDPDYAHYYDLLNEFRCKMRHVIPSYLPVEVGRGSESKRSSCCDRSLFQGYRERPPHEVAKSIVRMCNKYCPSSIVLIAENITSKNADTLFRTLEGHGRDYRIFCKARAPKKKEQLLLMKKAGVCDVVFDIEACDTFLLKKMNMKLRFIDAIQAMKHCEELGVRASGCIVVDFPAMTQRDMGRSVDNIRHLTSFFPLKISVATFCHDSPAYKNPKQYGIRSFVNSAAFAAAIPDSVFLDVDLPYKDFLLSKRKLQKAELVLRTDKWRARYFEARRNSTLQFFYLDCGDYLRIEDTRGEHRSIVLEGLSRTLYLYCDAIRSRNEILKRFNRYNSHLVQKTLSGFCRDGLMYREEDAYLSLAIRASNDLRGNIHFM